MKNKEIKIKKNSKKILTFKKLLKSYKQNDENLYKVSKSWLYSVKLIRDRYRYPKCKRLTHMRALFKDDDYNISQALINRVEDQLKISVRLKNIAPNTSLH